MIEEQIVLLKKTKTPYRNNYKREDEERQKIIKFLRWCKRNMEEPCESNILGFFPDEHKNFHILVVLYCFYFFKKWKTAVGKRQIRYLKKGIWRKKIKENKSIT